MLDTTTKKPSIKDTELIEELTRSIANTLANLGPAVDGIAIFIDEADRAPHSSLGEFMKVFT